MTTQRFRVTVEIASNDAHGDQLEAILDTLVEHVANLVDVGDADLGANLADSQFFISMYVDAEDQIQAAIAALAAARSAVHAAGGGTADWDQRFRELGHEVRALEPAAN